MMRLLIILAALGLIFYLARLWVRRAVKRFWAQMAPPTSPPDKIEKLVECSVCSLFLPHDKAIEKEGKYYCEAHANTKQ